MSDKIGMPDTCINCGKVHEPGECGPIWPDDLIKANAELGTLNVELMMQRTDLIDSIKEAINTKPSELGDWKRQAKRMLRKLDAHTGVQAAVRKLDALQQ